MKFFILYIILSITPLVLFSQLFVGSGGEIYIQKDALLHIPDDIINDGLFENEGDVYVYGNIINTGKYIPLEGSIILLGNSIQSIAFNNDTIHSLIVRGGGNKFVIQNLNILHSLELENGNLVPISTVELLLLENASVSDGSIDSYVQGTLYAKGQGNRYFPVGIPTAFMPVELHNINGNEPVIGITPHTFSNEEEPVAGKGTRLILQTRYWEKTLLSGQLEDARISLPLLPDDIDFYMADSVVVVLSDDYLGPYRSSGFNDLNSRIPEEYVTSLDTANKTFYTLGIFHDVNWDLFFIPNALSQFAPSPEDRVVKVYGNIFKPEGFRFTVKNQWGNTVFATRSLDEMEGKGWDGENQNTGRRETTGQYLYYLEGVTKHDEKFSTAGTIWILD